MMKGRKIGDNVHAAAAGLLSGAAAGVFLAGGSQLAMQMVAHASFFPAPNTVQGTLDIVWACVLIGAVSGFFFPGVCHLAPNTLWSGPLYGLAVMMVLTPILLPKLSNELEILTTPAQTVVATGSFGLAFYCYGLLLQAFYRRLRRKAPFALLQ